MARKTGRFSKILEFIGLVDDGQATAAYDEPENRYDDGMTEDDYAYTSRRSARRNPVPAPAPRSTSRTSYGGSTYVTPRESAARSGRMSYQSAYSAGGARANPTTSARSAYSARYQQDTAAARTAAERRNPVVRSAAPIETRRTPAGDHQSAIIFYLHSLEECCDIIENLIDNRTVLLNLDEMDVQLLQRAVDTLSGAAFALNATLRKVSDRTYLIAPVTVEVNSSKNIERRY